MHYKLHPRSHYLLFYFLTEANNASLSRHILQQTLLRPIQKVLLFLILSFKPSSRCINLLHFELSRSREGSSDIRAASLLAVAAVKSNRTEARQKRGLITSIQPSEAGTLQNNMQIITRASPLSAGVTVSFSLQSTVLCKS